MAYNEATSLPAVVRGLKAALQQSGRGHEILVVDDGSDDGTAAATRLLEQEVPGLRVLRHDANRGLGGVYRTGFTEARCDWLSFFPADGQFPASNLALLLAHAPAADLVLGYLKATDSTLGAALAWIERVLYRALFGALPRFQGVFLVRVARLRSLPLVSDGRGWAIVMEMIVRAQRAGWRIESVLTELKPRQHGASKVRNLRSIWANLRQLGQLRLKL